MTRSERQQVFLRICKDADYTMDAFEAAFLAGRVCSVTPLQIAFDFGMETMKRVASGKHPFCETKV